MTLLLVGNVNYFSAEEILKAFPEERLVILGKLATSYKKIRQIPFDDTTNFQQLFKSYDICQIIYFSNSLNAIATLDSEVHDLRRILKNLKYAASPSFLYVTGPDLHYRYETSRRIVMASAEQLCQYYAQEFSFSLKILRSLYLYDLKDEQDSLGQLFLRLKRNQKVDVRVHPKQMAYYICGEDLLTLSYRVLDSWTSEFEHLSIADHFQLTYSDILDPMHLAKDSLFSDELPITELVLDDSILKERYGWFPKVSLLEDLADVGVQIRKEQRSARVSRLLRVFRSFRSQTLVAKLITFSLLFSVSEGLSHVLGQQVYFKTVDYRLFFVMTSGLLFGTNLGLLAAVLATVGLVVQNVSSGSSNLATLFFEPSNWIPYMVYFISAMVCGYVKEKDRGELAALQSDTKDLQQQLSVERDFIDDLLAEKAELTHQILGRQDSYGKIYQFLTRLATPYQDVFMVNLAHHLAEIFETESIFIYSARQNQLAQLQFTTAPQNQPFQQEIEKAAGVFNQIEENGIWVNHHLREGYPAYMSALTDHGKIHYYLLIQDVPIEKMNLYHENLFKVLTGLATQSYQHLCLLNSKQEENGTDQASSVLTKTAFYQKLLAIKEVDSRYFYGQVLRLSVTNVNRLSLIKRLLVQKLSLFDTLGFVDGEYYLLFNARTPSALSDWKGYLQRGEIEIKAIQNLEETIEEIQFSQGIS